MSLISQNALGAKKPVKIARAETEATKDSDAGLKSRKRKKEVNEKEFHVKQEKEMKRLDSFLFGNLYSPVVFGKEEEDKTEEEALFITDRSGIKGMNSDEDVESDEVSGDEIELKGRKPAWVDEDESKITVDIAKLNRLRKLRKAEDESSILASEYVGRFRDHHLKLNPTPGWAEVGPRSGDGSDSDNESAGDQYADGSYDLLRTNEDIVVNHGVKLLPGLLEFSRLVDANAEDPSNGPINAVQFHRNGQLLLSAGLDRRLRFFQIDGKRNTKIQSMFLEDLPIRKASFLPDGSQVIAAGRRKFFYSFDLEKAKVDKIGPLTGRDEKS